MNRLLTHAVGPVPVDGLTAFAEPRFGGVGAVLPFAVWGQAGARWSDMALGVLTRDVGSASRVASARADALDTVERWCLMAPRRCALPVRGYIWSAHSDWIEVGPLWAPCISEDDRRAGRWRRGDRRSRGRPSRAGAHGRPRDRDLADRAALGSDGARPRQSGRRLTTARAGSPVLLGT